MAIARGEGLDASGELFGRVFAAVHNCCRTNDGRDPEHGARAADFWTACGRRGGVMDDARFHRLSYALVYHDIGRTSRDVWVGMCWDADRLDLVRVRRRPRVQFFRTSTDKRMCERLSDPEVLWR